MVVVTSHEDVDTRRICEYWNVQCVPTDALETRKGRFCKGAGINAGLEKLDRDGWLLHMDADIVLPPLTRPILEKVAIDQESIYGVDRFMVRAHDDWRRFMEMPRLLHENNSWIHLESFPIGTRVAIQQYGGWIPIGFFQLWHAKSGRLTYPQQHTSAARGDMAFALQWPREKRVFLPELVVYHLDSENSAMSTNWNGRKTEPFTIDGKWRRRKDPGIAVAEPQRHTGTYE
jgi:hypothetical protein